MKKTASIGVLFFVIGGLIGLGMGKMWWRGAPVSETGEVSEVGQLDTVAAMFPQGAGNQLVDRTAPKENGSETMKTDSDTSKKLEPTVMPGLSEQSGQKMAAGISSVISVSNQASSMQVLLTAATLEHAGWAVIHEDRGGKPGNILGAQRLNGGTHSNVIVDLLRGTNAGGIYYAMLHGDNGDRTFDYKVDVPLIDGTGNPVMVRFMAVVQ